MPPKQKGNSGNPHPPTAKAAVAPVCRHLRIIAEPIKVPDQVAFRCLDCDANLPPDFASPAH